MMITSSPLSEALVAVLSLWRNGNIKQERSTMLAILYIAEKGRGEALGDSDGWMQMSRFTIAEAVGISKATVSSHLRLLEEWGIIDKELRRTGPNAMQIELWIRPAGTTLELLEYLSTFIPSRPQWGGWRWRRSGDAGRSLPLEVTA